MFENGEQQLRQRRRTPEHGYTISSPMSLRLESLMLHTKFHRNRPTGSWKQDFLSIYTIYGHGSHLGHVTSIMLIFISLYPKNSIQNLVENDPVVSEKRLRKNLRVDSVISVN